MYISPINYNNNLTNKNINYKFANNSISFTGLTANRKVVGQLQGTTSKNFSDILRAYNDIILKLSTKSEAGIKYITENFPISIKDCLIFHNCGDNNNSIAINTGSNRVTNNLTHIVRRRGNSTWSERIIEEAYMVENSARLLKDFKTNYMRTFPQEREYMSQEEILQADADTKLQQLMEDLDPMMLKFRIFLSKMDDKYTKAPDGKLSSAIMSDIKNIERMLEDSKEESKKIPRLQLYKLLEEQHEEYVHLKGNSTHSFKNLGEEKVTIAFAPIESDYHDDLRRMTVHNQDGSLKRVFILQGDKLVKNTSSTNPSYLAGNFEFYDENEILKDDILGDFSKYLNLYKESVSKMQSIIHNRVVELETKPVDGVFPSDVSANLKASAKIFDDFYSMFTTASNVDKRVIKNVLKDNNITLSSGGIIFPAKELFKEIYFQPVKSNTHSNLLKFSILEPDIEKYEHYLIHDYNKIVKNYSPSFPNNFPPKIKYLEEINMPDLAKVSKDSTEILTEIKSLVEQKLEKEKLKRQEAKLKSREEAEQKRLAKRQAKLLEKSGEIKRGRLQKDSLNYSDDYKEFLRSCKEQFVQAIKNIDNGLEDFNKTMQEIQQRVTEFYNMNKNN